MSNSDHDISLDEKKQEQPRTKDRAVDPSSKNQAKPDEGAEAGKYPEGERRQRSQSDKE
jgi:hypothetical protein